MQEALILLVISRQGLEELTDNVHQSNEHVVANQELLLQKGKKKYIES